MAGEETTNINNINPEYTVGRLGMNMDNTPNQIQKGVVSYALNASVENFDANSVNYQNEPGNEFCLSFPTGYQLIGKHFINEKNKHVFFLVNPETGESEIGYMENNDCIYRTLVNAECLNFNINNPIHKAVHKITNCTTEIYWTDGLNPRRYLDIDNISSIYTVSPGTDVCDNSLLPIIDCNKLKIQPNFEIPELTVTEVRNGGDLTAGTYQFAIQYCDARGGGYTSYYSVTNPTPIADTRKVTLDFNYSVGKSIILNIKNIDVTGYYQYYNLAVIKTVNAITSVELVGTYFIDKREKEITYTGQNVTQIRLTVDDIFEKFPYYDIAQDLTTAQDILIWDNLTSIDRINYQKIANRISLQWQTYRIPNTENYADELNATNLRGYLRDEVYAFEIVFLLKNGKQTDGFHIPGRAIQPSDLTLVPDTNNDFIGTPDEIIAGIGYSPYWKIYNTGYKVGDSPNKSGATNYKGEWEYGEFSYWESTELYPCNENVWGELANQPIRHHKFPDVLVSPIFETPTLTYDGSGKYAPVMQNDAIYPIGVKLDVTQVLSLIEQSDLTREQKDNIAAFKIVRGDRSTNKSIVAKGILRNVGKYNREGTDYYYPNYPYNDLRPDPFIGDKSNAYTSSSVTQLNGNILCRSFTITAKTDTIVEFLNCNTNLYESITVPAGTSQDICSLDFPKPTIKSGTAFIVCNTYKRYAIINAAGATFTVLQANIDGNTTPTGGVPYHTFLSFMPNPHGAPPLGYPTWVGYCLDNPTDLACKACLSDTNYWVSKYNTLGQDMGYTYYFDTIIPPVYVSGSTTYEIKEIGSFGYENCSPNPLDGFDYTDANYRQIFNSPETSFGQPFLGNILKLESAIFGAGKAHFVQVKKNAYYKLLTAEAQQDALNSSYDIANLTGTLDAAAMFTAYQAYLQIYINGITRRNYAYSFNSIAGYDYNANIQNDLGVKQREIDYTQYIIPAVQSVNDPTGIDMNNWERESSVYIMTKGGNPASPTPLPFPSETPSLMVGSSSLIEDDSRFILSDSTRGGDCNNPQKELPIKVVAYYASMKNMFVNQWGQMYSYDTIDTGFQTNIEKQNLLNSTATSNVTIFGGDTFITRFAFKIKLPFFIDNRVGAPDDSDIFYDEIGNVAYPTYWHSSRSVLGNYSKGGSDMTNLISIKAHNFDCPNSQTPKENNPGRTYYDGKFYLFAYGIPNVYCETSINVDLRQAFNDREGDFWPHVSTGIPDDWVQESYVPIAQDNTYYYNVTFSKQNKENYFSHLPVDWEKKLCYTYFPFRAIYSDVQQDYANNSINNWLIYRPVSAFDFPQNFGKLTSLDGIQNKAILARFENKTLLYNNLLTIDTSNPQAAYIGNSKLFAGAPPIDFAETDLGYIGAQHKLLLKIPQGQVTIDAKRGQVFLITGEGAKDLSGFGSGLNRFFTDHLAFEILRYFPNVNVDNNFKGIGLHGVYDSKFDRVIISKLDYIPVEGKGVKFDVDTQDFYIETLLGNTVVRTIIDVTDLEYFCNKSWTLSYNMNTNSWVSFHSYIPNWYIAENNFFYTGLNGGCDLAAIAFEELPPTSSTTTTICLGCRPPESTTSTTTTILDCEVDGEIIQLTCDIDGTVIDVSPTTTTTSTTSTTTTLCPSCFTYLVTNTTDNPQTFTYISCYTNEVAYYYVEANGYISVCACDFPVTPEGVSSEMVAVGCNLCSCYTIVNNTVKVANYQYTACDGTPTTNLINGFETQSVCAQQGTVTSFFTLDITGGTSICITDGDCSTTTTTTLPPV